MAGWPAGHVSSCARADRVGHNRCRPDRDASLHVARPGRQRIRRCAQAAGLREGRRRTLGYCCKDTCRTFVFVFVFALIFCEHDRSDKNETSERTTKTKTKTKTTEITEDENRRLHVQEFVRTGPSRGCAAARRPACARSRSCGQHLTAARRHSAPGPDLDGEWLPRAIN